VLTQKLDSIIYQNGTKEIFPKESLPVLAISTQKTTYGHHLAGIDMAAWLYRNIRFSYEYFPFNPNLGFKASISFKTSPKKVEIWVNDYQNANDTYHFLNFRGYSIWHGTLGCDYYFLPPGSFRFLTGLHGLFGSYYINETITDGNYNIVETRELKKPLNGLFLNTYLFWSLNEYLTFDMGLDIPLIMSPPMKRAVFTAEFLLTF
jgi:hypothetical protein